MKKPFAVLVALLLGTFAFSQAPSGSEQSKALNIKSGVVVPFDSAMLMIEMFQDSMEKFFPLTLSREQSPENPRTNHTYHDTNPDSAANVFASRTWGTMHELEVHAYELSKYLGYGQFLQFSTIGKRNGRTYYIGVDITPISVTIQCKELCVRCVDNVVEFVLCNESYPVNKDYELSVTNSLYSARVTLVLDPRSAFLYDIPGAFYSSSLPQLIKLTTQHF